MLSKDFVTAGVLTADEFTHAKAAVIAGDDEADSFEEAGADAVPVKAAGGIGYMTFWSEAFTLLEKFGNIPKDHNLEWRQHLACSKQYDGASLRDGLTSTFTPKFEGTIGGHLGTTRTPAARQDLLAPPRRAAQRARGARLRRVPRGHRA